MQLPTPKQTVSVFDHWNDNFISFGRSFYSVGTLRNYAHGYCLLISYFHTAIIQINQNSQRSKETDIQVVEVWQIRYRYGRCHTELIFLIGALFNGQYTRRDLKQNMNGL